MIQDALNRCSIIATTTFAEFAGAGVLQMEPDELEQLVGHAGTILVAQFVSLAKRNVTLAEVRELDADAFKLLGGIVERAEACEPVKKKGGERGDSGVDDNRGNKTQRDQ